MTDKPVTLEDLHQAVVSHRRLETWKLVIGVSLGAAGLGAVGHNLVSRFYVTTEEHATAVEALTKTLGDQLNAAQVKNNRVHKELLEAIKEHGEKKGHREGIEWRQQHEKRHDRGL